MLKPSPTASTSTIQSVFELPADLLDLSTPSQLNVDAAISPSQAIDRVVLSFRGKLVRYTAFQDAIEAIRRCHEMGRYPLEEPSCLLITGVSGCGKSTLRKEYAKRCPRQELDDRTKITVLHLELPSQPTIKNVAERILIAMGDPFAEKGSAEGKTARIIKLMRECYVELVMLDEFQHFVDNAGVKVESKVADWLKHLINSTKVPFVLLGLPRCERILEVNEQLRRRFTPKIALYPFKLSDANSRRQFGGLLQSLQKNLPFEARSVLVDKEVIPLIYYATFGLIDYVMKLIAEAIFIALSEGQLSIDEKVLERAFRDAIWRDADGARNPFNSQFQPRVLNRIGEPFYGYLSV